MKKILTILGIFLIGALSSLGVVYAIEEIYIPFPDVNYDDYYGDSLIKMQERGVISGYENGNFGPNDQVTRAQLVTILDRYENSLFLPYETGRTASVLDLICAGIDDTNLNTSDQELYDNLCHPVVPL